MQTALPATETSRNRNFAIRSSPHGDLHLSFWNGAPAKTDRDLPDHARLFGMRHGSELPLLGALIGYYGRQGVDTETIRRDFLWAGQLLLAEGLSPSLQILEIGNAVDHTKGLGSPQHDIEDFGWLNLLEPVTAVPGPVERIGGTALFTRIEDPSRLMLVFARFNPMQGFTFAEQVNVSQSVELEQAEIPVIARAICENSQGDYRREIATFLTEYFDLQQ